MYLILAALRCLGCASLTVAPEVGCSGIESAVEAQLQSLAGAAPASEAAELSAHLGRAGGQLVLRLERPPGIVLARRELPDSTDCERIARAIAVVLSSWQAEFGEQPPSPSIAAEARSREVIQTPPPSESAPPSTPRRPGIRLEVGAVLLATAGAEGWGGAMRLDLRLRPFVLELLLETPARAAFGPGELHFERETLAAGGGWTLIAGSPELEVRALALGALNEIWGTGYSVDASGQEFSAGLGGGLRLAAPLGQRMRWVVDLSTSLWLASASASVTGLSGSYRPSRLQILLGAGMAFEGP